LAETYPRKLHGPIHISFYVFVLYLVKTGDTSEGTATLATSRSSCHWTGILQLL